MGSDEYFCSRSALRLKGTADNLLKKKKKKKKDKQLEANILREVESSAAEGKQKPSKTKAEMRFEERHRRQEAERILKKASKTHKEKVAEFNKHLDTLTEHFDIPKVSWTK